MISHLADINKDLWFVSFTYHSVDDHHSSLVTVTVFEIHTHIIHAYILTHILYYLHTHIHTHIHTYLNTLYTHTYIRTLNDF